MANQANMDCAGGAPQVQEIPIAIQDNMGLQDTASASFVELGLAAAMVALAFVGKSITIAIIEAKSRERDATSREVK